jgi:hypothetical protein
MTDRRITFIDVDENPLVVWLKDDRVQLFVVDSEPELEAGELRGFALALFATYVGDALATRLASARQQIGGVRDALAAAGAADALVAALDASLRAIEDVHQGMTAAGAAIAPDPAPATPPWPERPPGPSRSTMSSVFTTAGRLRKPTRAKPAREGELLGWGWGRARGDDAPSGPRGLARPGYSRCSDC